ncbi:MAG: hypothetical protein IPK22_17655 [Verrucomicrobiaceae bacterium]|nr:hypothetical protein [Verrucomicrobiaceae bacterium]
MLFWTPQTAAGIHNWTSITSSADGSMLAALGDGQIYTSADAGVTWTAQTSAGLRSWSAITSSADGSMLATVAMDDQIYTSTDSGVTWTARASVRVWTSITSSADGTKLAATAMFDDQIYTSADSGVTWTARASARNWNSITSSADGTKLAAVADQIYTSTDSGVTWTVRDSFRNWRSITSSADGTKLAAVADHIYTSTDSGVTWTVRDSFRNWRSIISSADGSTLAAVDEGPGTGGQIYISTDSGVTWTPRESNRMWRAITSSADGSKLAAAVNGGQIYTSTVVTTTPPAVITYTAPAGTGSATLTFQVQDSGLSNNLDLTPNTITFNYSPTPTPPAGTDKSLFVLAGSTTTLNLTDWGFSDADSPSQVFTAVKLSTLPTAGTLRLNGTDAAAGQTFLVQLGPAGATWAPLESSGDRSWRAMAASADGTKLAAVAYGGQIYTSTDSGANWTARESDRSWEDITCAADGSKLAAVVFGGQIYTSSNYGVSWTPRESTRIWSSITSSSDGSKLAACSLNGDGLFTSTDSGVTWTPRGDLGTQVTSSVDGTKLAVINGGTINTSSDSGVTWTSWLMIDFGPHFTAITSSADGSQLAAVVYGGPIYTSSDFGVSWMTRESHRLWHSIKSSSDGSRLIASTASGHNYSSSDFGAHWNLLGMGPTPKASSADGSRLYSWIGNGPIQASVGEPASTLTYVASTGTGSTGFTFQVQDSAAVNNLDLSPNTITIHVVTPMEFWRQTYFSSVLNSGNGADTADFDGDGIANLLEFAFGTHPGSSGNGPTSLNWSGTFASASFGSTGQPVIALEGSMEYRALFTRRSDYMAAGLSYTVQFSSDLSSWTDSTATPAILSSSGGHDLVSVPYLPGMNFFRVRVSVTP